MLYKDEIEPFIVLAVLKMEQRKTMNKWDELKETIKELYDNNNDKPDVENVTRFLLNLMRVLEKEE